MQRVLRSCLDPLPRFLSIRGLALVVGLVLLGTALSVHEYLESEAPARTAWPTRESAAPIRREALAPRIDPGECRPTASRGVDQVEASLPAIEASPAASVQPAAAYQPGSESTGS